MDIYLAAPTGRAAKRMSEATGVEASTLHRLLELNGALSDEDMRKNVLRNALLELKEFEGKYSRYKELSSIFDAIDNFEEELEREVV